MAETIETAIYRLRVEGEAQIRTATKAIEGMAVADEDATKSNRRLTQQIESGLKSYDAVLRAQDQYTKSLEINARARESGASSAEKMDAHLKIIEQRYLAVTKAAEAAAVAMDSQRRAQASLTALPGGVAAAAGGRDAYAAQFAAAAKAQDEQVASINRLRSAMNPLEVEQGKIAQQMLVYRQALRDGKISQTEFAAAHEQGAAALKMASVNLGTVASGTKAARYEMINMSRQIQDIGVSLASGQSPFMVLVQQGSQIYDVFASSERSVRDIFKSMGAGILSFVTSPLTMAITGITALTAAVVYLGVKWGETQKAMERGLIGAGRDTSAANINAFTAQNSGQPGGFSTGEGRAAGMELAKTGQVAINELHNFEEAVRGYAILTGKDIPDATKAMTAALTGGVKGVDELNKTYMVFDATARDNIRTMAAGVDQTQAAQYMIEQLSESNRKAIGTTSALSNAWNDLKNVFASIGEAPVQTLQQKIEGKRAEIQQASMPSTDFGVGVELQAQNVARLNAELAKLMETAHGNSAAMVQLSLASAKYVDAAIPQVEQIKKVDDALKMLRVAQEQGVGGPQTEQAILHYEIMRQKLVESQEATAKLNAETAGLREKWGGVSIEAARSAEALKLNLDVISAVGGAAQRAAQFAADYAAELAKAVPPAEALLNASIKRAEAEARALKGIQDTTRSMEEQNELAKARNISDEKRIASAQAYNQVIKELGDNEKGREEAHRRSSAVEESYRIRENKQQKESVATGKSALQQKVDDAAAAGKATDNWGNAYDVLTHGLWTADRYIAEITGSTEGAVRQARELQNAFNAAAFSAQAVANAADIIAENTARAAKTAADLAYVMQNGIFAPNVMPTGQLTYQPNDLYPVSYGQGTGTRIGPFGDTTAVRANADQYFTVDPITGARVAPATVAEDLTKSIDELIDSTDALNATNEELLSPYYTQDPRTSHIGFRSQGMAAGGYVDVPGYPSANDNMLATIPVASGERIYVDPMAVKRGTSGGGTTINISTPIMFTGPANRDEVGRTVYQSMQATARSIAAAAR